MSSPTWPASSTNLYPPPHARVLSLPLYALQATRCELSPTAAHLFWCPLHHLIPTGRESALSGDSCGVLSLDLHWLYSRASVGWLRSICCLWAQAVEAGCKTEGPVLGTISSHLHTEAEVYRDQSWAQGEAGWLLPHGLANGAGPPTVCIGLQEHLAIQVWEWGGYEADGPCS